MLCSQQEDIRRDQWSFCIAKMQKYNDWLTKAHAIRNAIDIIMMIIS